MAELPVGGQVLLFAKSPVPGKVKTRLRSLLDERQCVAVASALLQVAVRSLEQLPRGWSWTLCVDDVDCPVLSRVAREAGVEVLAQGSGDLGQRMERLATDALGQHPAVLIIGSDCTGYDAAYLADAAQLLEQSCEAVLGPAEDGGYVLIGLRRMPRLLFADIEWGSERVAVQQRERFRACRLQWQELPLRADVDRPADLWRVCPAFARPADQALVIARGSP